MSKKQKTLKPAPTPRPSSASVGSVWLLYYGSDGDSGALIQAFSTLKKLRSFVNSRKDFTELVERNRFWINARTGRWMKGELVPLDVHTAADEQREETRGRKKLPLDWGTVEAFYRMTRSPKRTAEHFAVNVETIRSRVVRDGWRTPSQNVNP